MSLTAIVRQALKGRGHATISQLLADVGYCISAARAAAEGRTRIKRRLRGTKKHTISEVEKIGKRKMITACLCDLQRQQQAVRIKPGLWRWNERHLKLFAG